MGLSPDLDREKAGLAELLAFARGYPWVDLPFRPPVEAIDIIVSTLHTGCHGRRFAYQAAAEKNDRHFSVSAGRSWTGNFNRNIGLRGSASLKLTELTK